MDRLRTLRLPNGHSVLQLNAAETSLQYRKIVGERMYLQHGIDLPAGATVIDVGANIGIASLFFHWAAPSVRVIAIEPAGEMFRALTHNLETYEVDHVALNQAVGSAPEARVLTIYPNNTSMSSVYADAEHDREITRAYLRNTGFGDADVDELMTGLHASYEQPCEVTTLSDVIVTYDVRAVDLLKVNVEKAEIDVLDGIREEHWPLIRQLTVQVHDTEDRLARLSDRLRDRGYEIAVAQDPLLVHTDIFDLFAHR